MSSARRAQAVSAANSRPDTVELMRAGSARTVTRSRRRTGTERRLPWCNPSSYS
jgi:hypothetical protein